MTSPMALPILTVQSDFADVIADVDAGLVPEDRFWLSCYKSGEPSVHAKVHVALDDVDRNLIRFTPKDGDVDFVKTRNVSLSARHSASAHTRQRHILLLVTRSTSHQHRFCSLRKNTPIQILAE